MMADRTIERYKRRSVLLHWVHSSFLCRLDTHRFRIVPARVGPVGGGPSAFSTGLPWWSS